MNRYRKIFHHITAEDVAKDNLRLLNAKKLEEKKIEQEEEYVAVVAEELHCDWRAELDKEEELKEEYYKELLELEEELQEGMTTSTLFAVSFGASDADLIGWDHTDENGDAIVDATDFFRDIDAGVVDDTGESYPGLDGNAVFVKDGLGAGTGSSSGFNIHGTKESYMWMAGLQGSESSGGFFRTSPLDGRFADTISVTAIVGNGSNGGTAPHASSWGLYVYHWHPGIAGGWTLLGDNAVDYTLVPANGAGELTTYTLNLPEAARVKDLHLNFGWYNQNASIYAGDIGITQIGIRRNTPKNVVMPLDDPQASAFIRTGEQHFASKGKKISGSKEERYKRVVDMLQASKEYTNKILGMQFPGGNAVLFGNTIKQSAVEKYQEKQRAISSAAVERAWIKNQSMTPQQHGGSYGQIGITQFGNFDNIRLSNTRSALSAAQRYSRTSQAQRRMTRGALNPFGQRTVRSGRAGRVRRPVYSGRPYQGTRGFGKTTYGTTNQATGNTYTNPGPLRGMSGTGSRTNPRGTLDKGTLPQRYIDKYGSRSVQGQQQVKMSGSAGRKTFGSQIDPASGKPSKRNFGAIERRNKKFNAKHNIKTPTKITPSGNTYTKPQSRWGKVKSAITKYGVKKGAAAAGKFALKRLAPKLVPGVGWASAAYDVYSGAKAVKSWWSGRKTQKNDFTLQGNSLMESKKLKSPKQLFDYPGKPSPDGFPDNPPAETRPDGFHKDYGKHAARYKKLDPQSAKAMPPTGDPETDALVKKQAKKPK